MAQMLRLSLADFRRGYDLIGRDHRSQPIQP